MSYPIQKEHELLCPGCGCVLREIDEQPHNAQSDKSMTPPPSLDIFLLGSALEKNVKCSLQRTPQQYYEERTLKLLIGITKKYAIPDRLAYATFNELKRKKRGFQSETEPIKQLLKILSKDENYPYIHKMRAIKARYEETVNR